MGCPSGTVCRQLSIPLVDPRVRLFLRCLDALDNHVDGLDAPRGFVGDLALDVRVDHVANVAAEESHNLEGGPCFLGLDSTLPEVLLKVEGRSGVSLCNKVDSPSDPVVVVPEGHIRLVNAALLENPESPDLGIERGVFLCEVLVLELDDAEVSVTPRGTRGGKATRNRNRHGGCCDVLSIERMGLV